ncbi:dienelactone hydrolase family-domain-containing protein [Kalaharituber pfeilii]|nr:dienelactone hydrolase family-domain-containing protein [Kalaharituber pfeilii]
MEPSFQSSALRAFFIIAIIFTSIASGFSLASNQPRECCISGHLHKGTPKGRMKEFQGMLTYFAYPPNRHDTSKIILMFTDIFGNKYVNSQLVADKFAALGYLVIVPDYFKGDAVSPPEELPPDFDLDKWLAAHPPEMLQPAIDDAYEGVMKEFKPKSIGAVGMCYGAKYAVRLLNGKVNAAFIAHPSYVELDEIAAITGPLSIAAAEIDNIFSKDFRRQTEDKLSEVNAKFQLFLYGNVEHGFTTRGDDTNPDVRLQAQVAFSQAASWFKEYV